MKKLIFIGLVSVAISPAFAQEAPQTDDQGKLEVRQSQKELSEEYEKRLALERDPDSKYLPMNQFINSGRRR